MRFKNKKTLYEQSQEKKELDEEIEKVKNKIGNERAIVIKKVSTFAKILQICTDGFYKIITILFWLFLMLLVSFAVTVLMNESIRNTVLQAFGF